MTKRKKMVWGYFLFSLIICLMMGIGQSSAGEVLAFGPKETKIEGSIKYTVIGKYIAHFNSFNGRILLDEKSQMIRSVYLEIDTRSIESNSAWCDRLARSRRLLYCARYPKIYFKSDEIIHDQDGYKVKGVLQMRGVQKRMIFPFNVGMSIDPISKQRIININGIWSINRKEFNIIWNKYLDRGGVLVGDYFTVSWGIRGRLK